MDYLVVRIFCAVLFTFFFIFLRVDRPTTSMLSSLFFYGSDRSLFSCASARTDYLGVDIYGSRCTGREDESLTSTCTYLTDVTGVSDLCVQVVRASQ